MYIIWGNEAFEKLKDNYTLLPLENIVRNGIEMPTYCVIAADNIGFQDLPTLDQDIALHNEFLDSYNRMDTERCQELGLVLKGRFGGEVDSFYEEILNRIQN